MQMKCLHRFLQTPAPNVFEGGRGQEVWSLKPRGGGAGIMSAGGREMECGRKLAARAVERLG